MLIFHINVLVKALICCWSWIILNKTILLNSICKLTLTFDLGLPLDIHRKCWSNQDKVNPHRVPSCQIGHVRSCPHLTEAQWSGSGDENNCNSDYEYEPSGTLVENIQSRMSLEGKPKAILPISMHKASLSYLCWLSGALEGSGWKGLEEQWSVINNEVNWHFVSTHFWVAVSVC